jgi:hypothetical protein
MRAAFEDQAGSRLISLAVGSTGLRGQALRQCVRGRGFAGIGPACGRVDDGGLQRRWQHPHIVNAFIASNSVICWDPGAAIREEGADALAGRGEDRLGLDGVGDAEPVVRSSRRR